MATFTALRDRINLLGRAEYHYDCLVTYFAQHYLDLKEAGYEPLPDRDVFQKWLRHLNRDIRPNLLQAWKEMVAEFGFELGDRVILDGTDFYPARVSCYPRENIVRFTGFAAKKDGKPGNSSVTAGSNARCPAINGGAGWVSRILAVCPPNPAPNSNANPKSSTPSCSNPSTSKAFPECTTSKNS